MPKKSEIEEITSSLIKAIKRRERVKEEAKKVAS